MDEDSRKVGGGGLFEGGDYFEIIFPSKGGDFEADGKSRGGCYSRKQGSGVFYAKIVQMTPLRLRRESL